MAFLFRVGSLGLGVGPAKRPGQGLGVLLRGKSLKQLRHGLDALGRLEPQPHLEHLGDVLGHLAVDRPRFGVRVRYQPLCRRNRTLTADHPVEHRRKAVFVGVAALKLGSGILFRSRISLKQLLMQAAACGAQTHGRIAGQPGAAIVQHPDVLGADAPVDQPHLMHGRHAVKDRLQHDPGFLGRDDAVVLV